MSLLLIMEINLRQSTEEDFEFIFSLNKINMKKYVDVIRGWNEEYERADMKTKFIPGAHKIIQADRQDIGVILIQEEPDHFKLTHLELLPEFQNKGIGTKLIKEVLDNAKAKNKYVWLKVLKTNPAIELYKKLGFVKIGEEELKYIMRFN